MQSGSRLSLLACVTACSCASLITTYIPSEIKDRDRAELSLLWRVGGSCIPWGGVACDDVTEAPDPPACPVRSLSVDGNKIDDQYERIYLLPGEHRIAFEALIPKPNDLWQDLVSSGGGTQVYGAFLNASKNQLVGTDAKGIPLVIKLPCKYDIKKEVRQITFTASPGSVRRLFAGRLLDGP